MRNVAVKVKTVPAVQLEAQNEPTGLYRRAPLRAFTYDTMIECTCQHCGLMSAISIGGLIKDGLGSTTLAELEETEVCAKPQCLGPLAIDVRLDG